MKPWPRKITVVREFPVSKARNVREYLDLARYHRQILTNLRPLFRTSPTISRFHKAFQYRSHRQKLSRDVQVATLTRSGIELFNYTGGMPRDRLYGKTFLGLRVRTQMSVSSLSTSVDELCKGSNVYLTWNEIKTLPFLSTLLLLLPLFLLLLVDVPE